MKQKVKAAIGANVLDNPYINRTYNKSFNAQRSTNNYIKKIANSKKIGSTISGITTGIAGIALGQPGLVKTGISDVVDGLTSTPLDNSSIQNIYGSGNMQNLSQYSGGIDPTVGAGLKGLINSYNFNMAMGGYVGKKSGKTLKSPALDLSIGNSYETDKGNSLDVNAALGLWKGSKSGVQQDLRLVGNAKPNINNYKAGLQFNTVAGGVNNRSKFEFPSNIEVGLEQYNGQYRPYLSNRIEWNKKRGTISKNDTYGLYSKQVLGGFGYAGKEYRDDKYINNQFVEGKVSDRFSKKPLGAQVLLGVHGSKEILPNMVLSGETYTDLIPDLLNASKNISTYGDYTNPKFGGNIKLTYKIPYNKARIKTPGHTPTPVTSGQYKNTRLFSDYARGGKIKFNPGGIFDIMPRYITQPDSITSMLPMKEYNNTPNIIGAQATPYTDKLTRKPIIQNAGDFLSTVNPLGLGSKLQNVGMDEYGVIENDAAYVAGSILNPIGAFANWAGNGFHGNTYMKDKRGQMLQNMTAENMSNEVGEKNVMKYGVDYDRLNRFNNRGNITTMNMTKGGLAPLSATSGTLVGPKHAQGGIDINPQVEAEGGEVMNAQPDGSAQIFSKQDGYADVVKPLLKQKGIYEQQLTQLLPVKEAMLKSFSEETDGLRRASLGRNLEKVNTDIFKYTQIVQQIDAQVQQIFAQQQEQNGNNGMQQMRHGGLLAKRGIEIPPFTPNSNGINWNNYRTIAGKEFTPPIYNNVYRINEENNSPLNVIPQPMGFVQGSIKGSPYYNSNEVGKGFNTNFIYNWRHSDALNDDDTNNWLNNDEGLDGDEYLLTKRISRVIPNMQSKQGYVIHTPYYTVPFDESLIDTSTPIAETPIQSKQRRSFRPNIDLSKYAGKFKNIQDVMLPAIELAEQSKLSNKMEAIQAPQSDLLQYNPIDVRYTPDYELNKLQSNMNTTIQEIRRNSSNPYYANALRNQLFKDNINTTGNIIDKVNKDNLNIAIQNNAGFNRVNEANNTIRFNNKQLNYEKAIGDLERRSDIVKTGIMRTREFMNNSRQYDLDVARLGVEGIKYADTIGGKYSDAYITGQLNNIAEQNKASLSNLANKEKLSEQEHLTLTNQIPLYVDYVNKGNEVDGNILRLFTKLGYNKVNGKWVK